TTALVGERPEHSDEGLAISVRSGAWHAYSVEAGEVLAEGVVLRHSELKPEAPVLAPKIDLGSVGVEGGTLAVLGEAARSDVSIGIDEGGRTRREWQGYGERSVGF